MDRIRHTLPPGRRLIEPFVGSGAVFLNMEYSEYLLADSNADLITLYRQLKTEGQAFVRYCQTLFTHENNQPEVYYQLRNEFNTTNDSARKSALFVYLNRHCFNGLCRYNGSGKFNTPFGKYKKPRFPETEMHFFLDKAGGAEFVQASFQQTLDRAEAGDVVYCDPPYVPLSETAKFTDYSTGGFGLDQQAELARRAKQLAERGVPVVLSNHLTDFTKAHYQEASLVCFEVRRSISCKGNDRQPAPELLAVFAPPQRKKPEDAYAQ